MNFFAGQYLPESPKILLTPRLKQALQILSMNCHELTEYIAREMEYNPVMEITAEGLYSLQGLMEEKDDEDAEIDTSLKDYLLLQLDISGLNPLYRKVAEYLIDDIDENGYLKSGLSEAAAYFNLPLRKVEEVLERLQGFDPPGVFARDLKECLLLQVKQLFGNNRIMVKMVENHLDDFAEGRFAEASEKLHISDDEVREAYRLIRTLEPKPGREFCTMKDIKYIVPDVYVKKAGETFEIQVNEDLLPVVSINEHYSKMIERNIDEEVKKFLMNRVNSAAWLIECIEQRKAALIQFVEYIVEKEKEFFKKGTAYKRVLSENEASEDLGIHEYVIGKIKEGKYLQCRWGTFELDYFFKQ